MQLNSSSANEIENYVVLTALYIKDKLYQIQ